MSGEPAMGYSRDGCARVSSLMSRCFEAYAKDPESDARCFDYLENMRKCCADYGSISPTCRGFLAERRKIEQPNHLALETIQRSTMIDKFEDKVRFSPADNFSLPLM